MTIERKFGDSLTKEDINGHPPQKKKNLRSISMDQEEKERTVQTAPDSKHHPKKGEDRQGAKSSRLKMKADLDTKN
jgi:hypothetical protein